MRRLLSFFGSLLLSGALLFGSTTIAQPVQAADACQFSCQVTLGTGAADCNPAHTGAVACATQCQTACTRIGMTANTTIPSTCEIPDGVALPRNRCSPCACIPFTSLACTGPTSGSTPHPYCATQCGTTCNAQVARVTETQGAGSAIACLNAGMNVPRCTTISQAQSVRLCRECISRCVTPRPGDTAQRTPLTCYNTCREPAEQRACAGVTQAQANLPAITPTTPTGGTPAPTTGGTTGGAAVGAQGTCHFNCTPQVPPQTCTTDTECASHCTTVCGRNFRNGQCATSGAGTPRCVSTGTGGTTKQCVFECSIGASAQERSCNPSGTDAQSPVTVCGGFCQATCAAAYTQRVTGEHRFCPGSAPICVPPTTGTAGGTARANTNDPADSASNGATARGASLINPIQGIDSIAGLVGRVVKGILGIVGSLALLMFVYGGIKWILSAGNPKEVSAAQNVIRNATIGLVLVLFSYSISSIILGFVDDIGGGGSTTSSGSSSSARPLATCVEYAVTHGHIGRNEAQDRTAANWACRQTEVAERDNRNVCIPNGCPRTGVEIMCCAPITNSRTSATTEPVSAPDTPPSTTFTRTGYCTDLAREPRPTEGSCDACLRTCLDRTVCSSNPGERTPDRLLTSLQDINNQRETCRVGCSVCPR